MSSFQMRDEVSTEHRPKLGRPHLVTELAENGRLNDWNADNGLTHHLHPRVLRPSMTLTTKGAK